MSVLCLQLVSAAFKQPPQKKKKKVNLRFGSWPDPGKWENTLIFKMNNVSSAGQENV